MYRPSQHRRRRRRQASQAVFRGATCPARHPSFARTRRSCERVAVAMLAISRKCARRGALTRLPASPARRALSCTSVARRVHTKREDAPPPPPRTASTKGGQSAKKDEGDSAEPERPDFLSTLFPFLAQRSAAIDTALSALVGLSMGTPASPAISVTYAYDGVQCLRAASRTLHGTSEMCFARRALLLPILHAPTHA
jgi:hypothetical protein